jgi:Fe-Mn family superoxide dismutase
MKLHHDKHHRAYVDKLNQLIKSHPELAHLNLEELLTQSDTFSHDVARDVQHFGGGHYNHSLFWQCMTAPGSDAPAGPLVEALVSKWGSLEAFKEEFNDAAMGVFGSGWAWLTADLQIITSANQDNPLMYGQGEPLMGLDVWEHAYYLDYYNQRENYIHSWWRIVDWDYIETRYSSSVQKGTKKSHA